MSILVDLLKDLMLAWRNGDWKLKAAVAIAIVLIVTGGGFGWLVNSFDRDGYVLGNIGYAVGAIGVAIGGLISVWQKSKEEVRREQKIEEVEQRALDNPGQTQVAWELARVKLESYLNRNLSQVRSIFWLTLLVMAAGFSLIGVGVYEAFANAANFHASVLAACSGVVVNFIGGTFLVLYKATMAQAKDYVTILERINAVGMSVQILETLENTATSLKDKTTAEVARLLLSMYAPEAKAIKRRSIRTRR